MTINSEQDKALLEKGPCWRRARRGHGQGALRELRGVQPRVPARPPGCQGISKEGKAKEEGRCCDLFTSQKENHLSKELYKLVAVSQSTHHLRSLSTYKSTFGLSRQVSATRRSK